MYSTTAGLKKLDTNITATDSTTISAKTSDHKTPTTDYSTRKEKSRKECVPEDPESDPSWSDSPLSEYDFSDDGKYKSKRRDKKKKYWKLKKQDSLDSSLSHSD